MNRRESVVIVGGGIWGLSTAYHLARAGWTDVVVLERNGALFDETTSQAAELVGQIRATPLMRRAIRYAIDLFLDFEKETDHDPGFHQVGSLLLALTPERMASFEEHVEHARRSGGRTLDGDYHRDGGSSYGDGPNTPPTCHHGPCFGHPGPPPRRSRHRR